MSSISMSSSRKMISLRSCDGVIFEVEEAVLVESQMVKFHIKNGDGDKIIHVQNVTGKTLAKAIEYLKKHTEAGANPEDLKDWDAEFVEVNQNMLYDLVMASLYLSVMSLRVLTSRARRKQQLEQELAATFKTMPLISMYFSSSRKKMMTLRSCDGVTFEVEEAVALQSNAIKFHIEQGWVKENIVRLSNVYGNVLAKVIEYCKKHVEAAENSEDLKDWDEEFVKSVDKDMFFNLLMAAVNMRVEGLKELTIKTRRRQMPEITNGQFVYVNQTYASFS